MTVRLGDLLAADDAVAVPDGVVAELRVVLDDAAARATAVAHPDDLPLRLPKDRILRLLACEQLAMPRDGRDELTEPIVRGRILDRLLHHHVHGAGAVPGPALAIAEGAFEAERDDAVTEWLLDEHGGARARLAEDASAFAERLDELGPIEPAWWPRCEERLRVDLAGGRVVCTAQLDLVVGGRPTGRPMVVVEVKSGRFGQDHRDGLFWYALLAALRHGTAPTAVIGWSAWDGAGWRQPVTEPVLRGAVERAIEALERLGEIVGGRTPARTPCRACAWCPERTTCPVAAKPEGDGVDDW